MKDDPDFANYLKKWTEAYHDLNYDRGMSSFFLDRSHLWLEQSFSAKDHFPKVLEVGAGSGAHYRHVRHTFDEYYLTDMNEDMLSKSKISLRYSERLIVEKQDASTLTYPSNYFDRLIAAHVLEHLERPHEVLREWYRVVRPGGVISLLLPCDPGLLWRIGRSVGSRRKFVKAGIDYDYWMAREHINSITNLIAFIRFYYDARVEHWYPLRVPFSDINLFYVCHITK